MARRAKERELPTETATVLADEPLPDDGSGLIDLDSETIQAVEPESRPFDPRAIPKIPGFSLTYEQLEEYLKLLTELQWSHIMVYIYRMWPIIYREPKNIDCASTFEQITKDYIISQHGGGKFKLLVCDTDRKKGQQIMEARLTVSHTDYPPILNYAELDTGHKDNRKYVEWCIAKGFLDQSGNPLERQTVAQQQAGDLGTVSKTLENVVAMLMRERSQAPQGKGMDETVITKSIDMVSGAYKQALDTAVKQGNTSDVDQLSKVMTMFTQMIGLLKPAESSSTGMWEKLLAMQSENHKAQLEMMRELLKSRTESPNPSGQLEGVLGMIEKVKNIFGLESGGAGKPSTLETVLDKAPTILEHVSRITGNFAQIQTARAGMAGIQPMQPAPGAMIPAAPPVEHLPMEGAQPMPAATAVDDLGFDPVAFCNQYGPTILSWINNNKTGFELAEWVEGGFGTTVYLSIRNIGKDKILRAMQAVPQYWTMIAPIQPQAEQFIDEFIGYQDLPADEDETPEGVEKPN